MPSVPADAPPPRQCLVEKATMDQEYGYNLHAERGKDQFVGTVDKGSPADRAGLRMGDRIFAVNGVCIQGESHRKVVERIKQDPMRCELLVIDEAGAAWYKEHNISVSPTLPNIIKCSKDLPPPEARSNNNKGEQPSSGSPPPAAWYAPTQNGSKDPVFVAPPPPTEESSAMGHNKPRPLLCHLEKRAVTDEFGFNLHAEKGKGHFIGAVDNGGIGDRAGLKMAQRIVGVNGVLVNPTTPHKEVIALIKKNPVSTTLLVAPEDVDQWYKQHNESYSFDFAEDGGAAQHGTAHTHDGSRRRSSGGLAPPVTTQRSRAPTAEDIAAAVVAGITVPEVIEEARPLSAVPEQSEEQLFEDKPLPYRPPTPLAADNSDDLMAAVFGAFDSTLATTVVVDSHQYEVVEHFEEPAEHELEVHHDIGHHYEEPPMDVLHHEEFHHEEPLHEEVHHHAEPQHHEGGGIDLDEVLKHVAVHEVVQEVEHHVEEEHHHHSHQEEIHQEERPVDISNHHSPEETPIMTPEPTTRNYHIGNGAHVETKSNGHGNGAPLDIFGLSAKEAREILRQNKRRDLRGIEMSIEEKHRIVSSM